MLTTNRPELKARTEFRLNVFRAVVSHGLISGLTSKVAMTPACLTASSSCLFLPFEGTRSVPRGRRQMPPRQRGRGGSYEFYVWVVALSIVLALGVVDLLRLLVKSYNNTVQLSHKVAEVVEVVVMQRQAHGGGNGRSQSSHADWRTTKTINSPLMSTSVLRPPPPLNLSGMAGASSQRISDALAHPIWWDHMRGSRHIAWTDGP